MTDADDRGAASASATPGSTPADAPEDAPAEAPLFDRRMLEALICPESHNVLEWDAARQELVSKAAGLAYPVRNGIPVMLVSEARRLDP